MNNRFIIIITCILLLLIPNVLGVAMGVNKAVLNFENVLRGGYAQDSIIISTDSSEDVGIEKIVSGDIEKWVRFEQEELIVNMNNAGILTVIIEPPEDTAVGSYEGELRLLTTPIINTRSGNIGSAIRTSFMIKIEVQVTGDEIISCTAGGFNIKDAEITFPLEFTASVKNSGNVRIKPDFEVDIWNQDQTQLLSTRKFSYLEDILPTTTKNLNYEIEEVNLDTGQYWADVKSPLCGQTGLITFSILEKGEIVDKGELLSIKNDLWVKIGDIVPIKAVFKNTGSRVESVKLKGTIKLAGQIIKVVDTDPLDVKPGQTAELEAFFNPKMAGQYIIDLRVLYNNKLTFSKGSILNALPSEEFDQRIKQQSVKAWTQVIIILIMIGILFMLIKIKKKKRTKKVKFSF
ncbi:MAG: hypothetical protein KKF89_01015 [Nanoarchaeota archaeon]|nr:hypothetical protein [Nanoarchaeota archaeon]MBU1854278.1 hypothetical protein [Nanoarchaeota archaeon]